MDEAEAALLPTGDAEVLLGALKRHRVGTFRLPVVKGVVAIDLPQPVQARLRELNLPLPRAAVSENDLETLRTSMQDNRIDEYVSGDGE